MWILHFQISNFRELMCHMKSSAWINTKLIQQSDQDRLLFLRNCVFLFALQQGTCQVSKCATHLWKTVLWTDLPETLGEDGPEGQNCPWRRESLEVLSNNIQNAVLSTEDDNRRATKSAWRTSDLFIVAQDLCTALCVAALFGINVNHVPPIWTPHLLLPSLFFLPTQLWPSSAYLPLSSLLTLVQEGEQMSWLSPPAGVAPLLVRDAN